MAPLIDSLVNQLVPLRTSGASPAAAFKPGVIEAVVLSNSPLLNSGGSEPEIRVTLESNQQRYEITTQVPIPVGARVQLRITADNLAVLLAVKDGANASPQSSSQSLSQSTQTPTGPAPQVTASQIAAETRSILKAGQAPGNATTATATAAQSVAADRALIEQTLRETLPQQQSLRTLAPLLQTLLQQQQALPKPLATSLRHLLRQFPSPEQLQHPGPVKRALQDSGIFLESKLARRQALEPAQRQALAKLARQPDTPINRDIKGLIERLLPQVQGALRTTPSTDSPTPAPTATGDTSPLAALRNEFAPPTATPSHGGNPQAGHNQQSGDQNLDVLLRQLGRQLLATLAKTQLNQMESLGHRHHLSQDPQSPVNNWSLEIPIVHGGRVDNLELRIEQREEQNPARRTNTKKQWSVMLNFDLHQLGKMQVQLSIVEQSVSAAVWSQQAATHRQVQQHLHALRSGLERVGVSVRQVECHLGVAPKGRPPLYQRLVDVRT